VHSLALLIYRRQSVVVTVGDYHHHKDSVRLFQ